MMIIISLINVKLYENDNDKNIILESFLNIIYPQEEKPLLWHHWA